MSMNTTFDDRDASVLYQPQESWFWSSESTQAFGNTFMFSTDPNAYVVLSFPIPAAAIYWQGFKRSNGAAYEVCLDCSPEDEHASYIPVDGNDPNAQPSDPPTTLFALTGLSNSKHTLVIRNRPDPRFDNRSEITVDSFILTTSQNQPIPSTSLRPLPSTLTPAMPTPTSTATSSAATPKGNLSDGAKSERVIIGVVLGVVGLIICLLIGFYFWWSRKVKTVYRRLRYEEERRKGWGYKPTLDSVRAIFTAANDAGASPRTNNSATLINHDSEMPSPRVDVRRPSPPPKDGESMANIQGSLTTEKYRPPSTPPTNWVNVAKTIENNPLSKMPERGSIVPSDAPSLKSSESILARRVSASIMASPISEGASRPSSQSTRPLSIPGKTAVANTAQFATSLTVPSYGDIAFAGTFGGSEQGSSRERTSPEPSSNPSLHEGSFVARNVNAQGQPGALPDILTSGPNSMTVPSADRQPAVRLSAVDSYVLDWSPPYTAPLSLTPRQEDFSKQETQPISRSAQKQSYRASFADMALARRMLPSELPTVDTSAVQSLPSIPAPLTIPGSPSLAISQLPLSPWSKLKTGPPMQTGDLVRTPTVQSAGVSFSGSRSSTPFSMDGSAGHPSTTTKMQLGLHNPFVNFHEATSRASTGDAFAYGQIPGSQPGSMSMSSSMMTENGSILPNMYMGTEFRVVSPAQSLSGSILETGTRGGKMTGLMPAVQEEGSPGESSILSSVTRADRQTSIPPFDHLPSILRPAPYGGE